MLGPMLTLDIFKCERLLLFRKHVWLAEP